MRLRVTYDHEAGCAYVYVGAARRIVRTVELDPYGDTMVDYDEKGEVVGIEFIGVSMPEFELLAPPKRNTEDVTTEGDLL